MAVVPPFRPGLILPLAPLFRRGWSLILFAFEMIGTVARRSRFALSTEESILELAVLTAKLLDFGFELLGTMNGPSMLSLPIPDLPPQFGILAPQFMDFLSQLENFTAKLPNQFGQLRRRESQRWGNKRAFHDTDVCTQNRSREHRAVATRKRFGRSFTDISTQVLKSVQFKRRGRDSNPRWL
jgi:hypothetical protein